MKKRLLFLWTFLLCAIVGVSAAEVTIDFTAKGYEDQTDMTATAVEQDGVTVTFSQGTNTNKNSFPQYYTNGTAVRLYAGNTMTVAPTSSTMSVTNIVITFGASDSSNDIIVDGGTYADGTWNGSASSVTFTVDGTKGNRRIAKLEVTMAEVEARPTPIEISPATGTDLTTALNEAKAKVDKVGDITINLVAGGAYTVSGTLEAPASIIVNGNKATIDASALSVPVVSLSATPSVEVNEKGAYIIDAITLKDVNITNVKNSLIWDGNVKYGVAALTIDNALIQLATEAVTNDAVIAFQAGGVKDFTMKNSTVYNTGASAAKYFLRYNNNGRLDNLGYDKNTETQSWTYLNNTFYKSIDNENGQWGNGPNGQKYMSYDVQGNIWYDSSKDIIRRLTNGRYATDLLTFSKNTYWRNGADISVAEASYDKSGTALVTDPTFVDAANADFHVFAGSQQAKEQTGDPRWLVAYDAAQALPVPVTISPEIGTDIATALNEAKAKVDKVGNITINLATEGAYTVSGSLEAPASIIVNGNKATIDASALSVPVVSLSATPSVEANEKGAYIIDAITLKDVNITNVKNSLIWDGNVKYGVVALTIDNALIQLATEAVTNDAVIAFQAGGVKDFTMKNSTVYNTGASAAKYFLRYNNNGRLDNLGYDKNTETQSWTYLNNTFYKSIDNENGQWGNGPNGQKYMSYDVQGNIWYDSSKDIIRRLTNGRYATDLLTFSKNTYWRNGADISVAEASYDKSGTALVTNPTFVDAANGDFTIGASTQQAKEKTGDPRWLVEYVAEDITEAKAALKAEIETATALLGDADTETDEAAKALKDAIDKAQGVYDTAEFNEILKAATEELKAAEEAYKKATSGISNIGADANADNGAWYNLQGVRMEKPTQKGIYIHNGKKIVVK